MIVERVRDRARWNIGTMEYWNNGMMDCFRSGKSGFQRDTGKLSEELI